MKSSGGKRSGPAGSGPPGCPARMRGVERDVAGAPSKVPPMFRRDHASAPVHSGGTASIGFADDRGVRIGPGEGARSFAAGRLAGRHPRGRGAEDPRLLRGAGSSVSRRLCCERGPGIRRPSARGCLGHALTLAASEMQARRPRAARLETRTKESDACASGRASGAPRAE